MHSLVFSCLKYGNLLRLARTWRLFKIVAWIYITRGTRRLRFLIFLSCDIHPQTTETASRYKKANTTSKCLLHKKKRKQTRNRKREEREKVNLRFFFRHQPSYSLVFERLILTDDRETHINQENKFARWVLFFSHSFSFFFFSFLHLSYYALLV